MPTARVNGVRLYYEQYGDEGEPLLLVHGYTGDMTDWEYQVAEFSTDYRVFVVDLRGHGRSEAPADRSSYTVETMARDVGALAERLGLERYHLVGHSMGGCIVQEMALATPERLLSLTLEDTGPIMRIAGDTRWQEWNAQQIAIAESNGMRAVVANRRENAALITVPMPQDLIDRAERRMEKMSVDGFIGSTLAGPKWRGTMERAATISVPTLVVYGELDVPTIVLASQWLAGAIPNATQEVIPGAGHSPQWEKSSIFNRALRAHLEAHHP